jgi:hypothetical protein
MVEFVIKKKEIELKEYSDDASLVEFAGKLEAFRKTNKLKTSLCCGCGECCSDNIPVLGLDLSLLIQGLSISLEELKETCLTIPMQPDLQTRRKAIKEMVSSNGLTTMEATLIYEYNNSEPIILAKKNAGECCFLENKLCSKYEFRPYSCSLYLCNMGEKLSYLQEMIIRQGTWHAYHLLGWIPENEIAHNPFLKSGFYNKLLIKDFDFELENALEQLFFYF